MFNPGGNLMIVALRINREPHRSNSTNFAQHDAVVIVASCLTHNPTDDPNVLSFFSLSTLKKQNNQVWMLLRTKKKQKELR